MTDNRNMPQNTLLERVDGSVLGQLAVQDGGMGAPRTNFLPATFAEAMEMSKLMAAGNFVPKHLRGKAGDCLAVVMQSSRWGMDPFAVANKTYFVNDRMAYEAQLVAAVVNTSGMLVGRLDVTWRGEGEDLICTVRGNIKGDTREKAIEQVLRTITTRNSPLWKQSPQMQLGYYTQRLWARLFTPEVLLGVYSVDEVEAIGPDNARQVPGNERRTAPTRSQVAERVIVSEPVKPRETYDAETGEVDEDEEAIARRLDAQAEHNYDGTDSQADDDAGDVDEQIDDEVPHMTAAAEPEPEPVAQQEAAPAAINWESWLSKFDTDLGKLTTVEDVNAFYASKTEKLVPAPDGIKNRARGYVNARLRALAPPQTTTTPTPTPAKRKPATKAEPAAPAEAAEQAPAANDTAAEDDVSPATKKADELIALFGKKETIIDLRKAKADADDAIDAMDDDNAARVTRSFRALEDKLKGPRR